MKKNFAFLIAVAFLAGCSYAKEVPEVQEAPEGFVFVQGGNFANSNSNLYDTDIVVESFFISVTEVTQSQWVEVMGSNPSQIIGDDRPVETITWYDAILFANTKSLQHGLQPFYNIDKENNDPGNLNDEDYINWLVTINPEANGFRLPTEIEWEFAASGGTLSRSYLFSGNDDIDLVAWYFRNSGDYFLESMWHWPTIEANNASTHPVAGKEANELGIYDMSGNVREWVWDWFSESEINPNSGSSRGIRGGGWVGSEVPARVYERRYMPPHYSFYDLGLRLVKNN